MTFSVCDSMAVFHHHNLFVALCDGEERLIEIGRCGGHQQALVGCNLISWVPGTSGMVRTGELPTTWMVFIQVTMRRRPGGATIMLPLHVWCDALKLRGDLGARLICLNILKKAKARQTIRPRLVVSAHSWSSRVGG